MNNMHGGKKGMGEVYLLLFPNGGKKYVGISAYGAMWRWRQHIKDARRRPDLLLYRAINKYGAENVRLYVLARTDSIEMLKRLERFYISALGSHEHDTGYNRTLGGDGMWGYVPSAETRSKLSRAGKGRPHSLEHRAKISESHKGKKLSIETRQKIREYHVGKSLSEGTKRKISAKSKNKSPEAIERWRTSRAGYHHSEETRAKIGLGNKGKIISKEQIEGLRLKLLGRKDSPETVERKRQAGLARWARLRAERKETHGNQGIEGRD